MSRPTNASLMTVATQWITAAAASHPRDLVEAVARRLELTRRRAATLVSQLVAAQWLVREGGPRRPCYRPGPMRQVVQRYPLEGLQEDQPWRSDFSPYFDLSPQVRQMAQHGFTELVNNAVDHSGGTRVTVSLRQTPLHLQLLVSDDGIGLFDRIEQTFTIADPRLAMFELGKGKLTSLPDRHCGHGLFFISRMADVFHIHANRAAFQHRSWMPGAWNPTKAAAHGGTSVYMAISLDTDRTLDRVLRSHSLDAGYGFDRTRIGLKLLAGDEGLLSRADARRICSRLDRFEQAEIDFSGVQTIGHGFADELFRVFARRHSGVRLTASGMSPAVDSMVQGVLA